MAQSFSEWRTSAADYIREDFRAYPLRFCLELLRWAISIGRAGKLCTTSKHQQHWIRKNAAGMED
jgi:hypothetical protein